MFQKRIKMGEGECLTLLKMASNVAIDVWHEPDVLIQLRDGEEADLEVEATEAGPAVSSRLGCDLQVPATLLIKARQVLGNLRVNGLDQLDAEQVRGNLSLSNVKEAGVAEVYGSLTVDQMSSLSVVGTIFGSAALKGVMVADLQNVRGNLRVKGTDHMRASRIGGNLQAKEIGGPLELDQVGGNATLKDIAGPVTLGQVAGNLAAKGLASGAKAPMIGGNLALNGAIGAGRTYHFQTRGNAALRLPEETNAHLTVSAKGKILSSLTLLDEVREGNTLRGTMGDGGAEIAVEARGNVILGGGSPEVGAEVGAEIARQIEDSLQAIDLEAIGRQVSEEMDAALSRLQIKLESVDWEKMGVRTQQAVERAMGQMHRNMDRMVEKAARHQEQLERKMEREQRRLDQMERRRQQAAERQYKAGAPASAPEAEQVSERLEGELDVDEERLSILRMVEQGQITPEEAEMLLDALQ
jgi:hypothetical protein